MQDLRLSEPQSKKAEEVLLAHHEKVRELHDKQRAELLTQLKDVLDDDQLKKFEQETTPPGPPPAERPESE